MKKLLYFALCLIPVTSTSVLAEDGRVTLTDSVAAAIQHHPEVKALFYNREAMCRNVMVAYARFFPTIDLRIAYGIQDYSSLSTRANGSDEAHLASDSSLKLTQNIFDGMDRSNTYEAAKLRFSSAEFRLLNNLETVGLDAIRAHVDVVRQRTLIDLAEKNIQKHNEVLSSIAERVAAGAGNKADEMQANSRVARAQTTMITYKGELKSAEAAYYRATGKAPEYLDYPAYVLSQFPNSMNEILDVTLQNHPLVKVYQAEKEATERDKKVVEAAYYPNLDLELSTEYTDDLNSEFNSYTKDDRAMLVLSWNLFRGGRDYHQAKAAQARIKQAGAELQNTSDDLRQQVAVAWSEYQTARGQVDKYEEALGYSIESRDLYLIQFNVGQRSLLDVLDAINEVFSNSVLLETAQSNRTFALYKFQALAGNLLRALEISEPIFFK